MRIACSVQCTSRTRTVDRKTIGARTARNAQVKIASCSTEQREIDESAKAGDLDLRADRNEGQQEGSDQLRVANQLIGDGLVQDGEKDEQAHA